MGDCRSPNTPEPSPIMNDHPAVWDLVIEDMKDRDEMGVAKYGTHLQPFNGRSALRDAFQEVLDLAVYLRQKIYEEEHVHEFVVDGRKALCSCGKAGEAYQGEDGALLAVICRRPTFELVDGTESYELAQEKMEIFIYGNVIATLQEQKE